MSPTARLGVEFIGRETVSGPAQRTEQALNRVNGAATRGAATQKQMASSAAANAQALGTLSPQMSIVAAQASALNAALGPVALALGAMAAAVGVTGKVMFGFAKDASAFQETLDNSAEATGFTSNQIAGLRIAAIDAGGDFRRLNTGLASFVQRLDDGKNGLAEAVRAFNALGISQADLQGPLSQADDALRVVAQRLRDIPDPTERAQIAMELFGTRSARLIKVFTGDLDEMSETAKRSGHALSALEKDTLRKYDSALDTIGTNLEGIKTQLGLLAAVRLGPLVEAFASLSGYAAQFATSLGTINVGGIPIFMRPLPGATAENVLAGQGLDRSAIARQKIADRAASEAEARRAAQIEFDAAQKEWLPGYYGDMRTGLGNQFADATQGTKSLFEDVETTTIPTLERLSSSIDDVGNAGVGMADNIDKLNEAMTPVQAALENMAGAALDGLGSALADAIIGVQDFEEAIENWLKNVAAMILEQLTAMGLRALLHLPFQQGGVVRAQTGLVTQGVRGVDSVPALLGRGEAVISHRTTDRLAQFLERQEQGGVFRMNGGGAQGLTLNLTVHEAALRGRHLEDWARDDLAPTLLKVLRSGGYR